MLSKKEYNKLMNENWANLLFKKSYNKLNTSAKKLVKIAIANDQKHNNEDKKKIINKNKSLYNKGKVGK